MFELPELPLWTWRRIAGVGLLLLLATCCGAMGHRAYSGRAQDYDPRRSEIEESASRIWALLATSRDSSSEVMAHAVNICIKSERGIAELARLANSAEEPFRSEAIELLSRLCRKAQEAIPASATSTVQGTK